MTPPSRDLRDALHDAVIDLAAHNPRILVLDSDVSVATKLFDFKKVYPDRFIQLGIAEQNTICFAAGLANVGFIPLVNEFGCFASRRAVDQVYVHLAYGKSNVKILGGHTGLTTPNTGATHQELVALTFMRAIPNMTVIEPADEIELRSALQWSTEYSGPVYLRLSRGDIGGGPPSVSPEGYTFQAGKGCVLSNGDDVTLIGCGMMVSRCLGAAELLAEEGINARVINMASVKPIDESLIVQAAMETGSIVTAENHTIIGGLGGAIAEVLSEKYPIPVVRVGIRDRFGESGALPDLFEKYGLTATVVAEAARAAIRVRDRKKTII